MTSDRRPVGRRAWWLGLVVLLAGCGGYPEVSPKTYEFAKALYGICNRQQLEKLDPVTEQIEAARDADEITAREAGWLLEIVETAGAGDWTAATAEARRLMEDQVRR